MFVLASKRAIKSLFPDLAQIFKRMDIRMSSFPNAVRYEIYYTKILPKRHVGMVQNARKTSCINPPFSALEVRSSQRYLWSYGQASHCLRKALNGKSRTDASRFICGAVADVGVLNAARMKLFKRCPIQSILQKDRGQGGLSCKEQDVRRFCQGSTTANIERLPEQPRSISLESEIALGVCKIRLQRA